MFWLAVKARKSKFAHVYTFFVARAGAYAIGFAAEMVPLQIDGYIPGPQPWPVVTWSILGLTAFAIAGVTMTSGLIGAIPCWIIAAFLFWHGVVQDDQVPIYTGAIMIGFGIIVLIAMRKPRVSALIVSDGAIMDREELTNWLEHELADEKAAQMEGAKVVLKPLTFVVAAIVFALCFWRYDIGLLRSIGAAILIVPAMGLGVALPVGYILGKRAAPRLKTRMRNETRSRSSSQIDVP